jgi:hypothetical protein
MRGKFLNLKLLCFLFITFFILGFGGEVRAEEIGSRKATHIRPETYFQWLYDINENRDVYCLNHSALAPSAGSSYSVGLIDYSAIGLTDEQKNAIVNIIRKSSSVAFNSDEERYYVTQAAIWYVKDGIRADGDDGITQGFYNWLISNYSNQWNALLSASGENLNGSTEFTIGGSSSMAESGNDMISGDFSIFNTSINSFTVSIDSGSSDGACILYNNSCSTTVTIPKDTAFKIRIPKNEGTEVHASFTVTSSPVTTYDLNTYVGTVNTNWQKIAKLKEKTDTTSVKSQVVGQYTNKSSVSIRKIDASDNKEIAGATLQVLDSSERVLATVVSTASGVANPSIELPVGNYLLKEIRQPDGYVYNGEPVPFSIEKDGNNYIVKQNGAVVDSATITFSNHRRKVRFRKVDQNGDPIEGLQIKLTLYSEASTGGSNSTLCAITDSNGYLTRNCPGDDNTNNARSDGFYSFGVDFGRELSPDDILTVDESCPSDSTNCDRFNKYKFIKRSELGIRVIGNRIISLRDWAVVTNDSYGNALELTIKNKNHVKIGKVDITGGNEVIGAKLKVTDYIYRVTDDLKDNAVDSWTSDGSLHEISGIAYGRRYRLTEELPAPGYSSSIVKNVNAIDFIVDSDGNVTTYEIGTGEEIADLVGTNYELLVKNDYTHTVFSKTSATTGEEIEGAELKVCTSDSYNVAKANGDANSCAPYEYLDRSDNTKKPLSWISKAGESKMIDALPSGTYYFVETMAPKGYYTKTSAVEFEVKSDGSITKVNMENKPTKVVISKKDQVTGERIATAHMEILNASDRTIAKDYTGTELRWISKSDEDWEILGLPVGDYILVETVVPEGYQEGMIIDGTSYNEYNFSVIDDDDELYLGVFVDVLNAPNTGISTLNLFAIGGLLVFAGYETIKIYRRKALN